MQGNKRVTESLDIVKILKDIRYLKLLAQMHINPDIDTKFKIYHSNKNVINIDDEDTSLNEIESCGVAKEKPTDSGTLTGG